jgi:hypothetical protein
VTTAYTKDLTPPAAVVAGQRRERPVTEDRTGRHDERWHRLGVAGTSGFDCDQVGVAAIHLQRGVHTGDHGVGGQGAVQQNRLEISSDERIDVP